MDIQFQVNLPLKTVFDYLTDMQKFVSYHPVITKIDKTGTDAYLIHETLKLGLVPISFTYPVKVTQDNIAKKVIFEATVMKVNQIKMEFTLVEEGGSTQIFENITFKTFLPIKPIMAKIFKAQHEKLFNNMRYDTWKS